MMALCAGFVVVWGGVVVVLCAETMKVQKAASRLMESPVVKRLRRSTMTAVRSIVGRQLSDVEIAAMSKHRVVDEEVTAKRGAAMGLPMLLDDDDDGGSDRGSASGSPSTAGKAPAVRCDDGDVDSEGRDADHDSDFPDSPSQSRSSGLGGGGSTAASRADTMARSAVAARIQRSKQRAMQDRDRWQEVQHKSNAAGSASDSDVVVTVNPGSAAGGSNGHGRGPALMRSPSGRFDPWSLLQTPPLPSAPKLLSRRNTAAPTASPGAGGGRGEASRSEDDEHKVYYNPHRAELERRLAGGAQGRPGGSSSPTTSSPRSSASDSDVAAALSGTPPLPVPSFLRKFVRAVEAPAPSRAAEHNRRHSATRTRSDDQKGAVTLTTNPLSRVLVAGFNVKAKVRQVPLAAGSTSSSGAQSASAADGANVDGAVRAGRTSSATTRDTTTMSISVPHTAGDSTRNLPGSVPATVSGSSDGQTESGVLPISSRADAPDFDGGPTREADRDSLARSSSATENVAILEGQAYNASRAPSPNLNLQE